MFESSLVASQPPRRPLRHRPLLPVAALAHGVLVGGILLTSAWSVDALPEPDLTERAVFVVIAPPPPLANPGLSQRPPVRPPRAPERAPAERQPVQPTALPAATPPAPEAPDEPLEVRIATDGEQGSRGGSGSPFGVPGGTGEDPLGDVSAAGAGERAIHLRAGITPPEVITRVLPAYTEPARRARIEGMVILEAIIDGAGRVTAVRVLRSLPLGLEQSAVEAVRQWRFRPARLNGRPQSVYFTLTVKFELQ